MLSLEIKKHTLSGAHVIGWGSLMPMPNLREWKTSLLYGQKQQRPRGLVSVSGVYEIIT